MFGTISCFRYLDCYTSTLLLVTSQFVKCIVRIFYTLIFFTLFLNVESPLRNIYDRQTKTFLQYLSQRFGCVIINLLPTLNISSMRLVS